MKKKIVYKMFIPLFCVMLLVFGAIFLIVNNMTKSNIKNLIANINSEHIKNIISEKENKEKVFESIKKELDHNYIRETRLIAKIFELAPDYLEIEKIKELSSYAELDEIYVMDKEGIIISGTDTNNLGYDFKTQDQTRPFMKIIDNPDYTLAQDYMERGADRELYKYVGVKRLDDKGIVQIGIKPHHIENFIKKTGIKNYFENIEKNDNIKAYITDTDFRILEKSSNVKEDFSILPEEIIKNIKQREGSFITNKKHLINYYEKDGHIYILEDNLKNINITIRDTAIYMIFIFIFSIVVLFFSMLLISKHFVLKPVSIFTNLFRQTSEGNLSTRSDIRTKDEMNVLGENFNAFMEILETLILQIRNGGKTILESSKEMSRANEDLAKKTAVQATVLQKTSATMEQISSIVKINTEKTKQANEITGNARKKAEIVAGLSNDLKISMNSINNSSKSIENIIEVIDEIAFQTNLLALNAAVEAARAGEQGRGFAVVAAEVRNLAQRSGKAAKEIKEKIRDSVEKIDEGNLLVENTITSLNKIVSEINSISEVIYEITRGANEQAEGIIQMNESIADIDTNIQVNATISEENSAAASVLYNQAKEFLNFVDFFKTENYEDFEIEEVKKVRKWDEESDMSPEKIIPFDDDIEEI